MPCAMTDLDLRDCPKCERTDSFEVDREWGAGYCGACDYYGAVEPEDDEEGR